MKTLNKKNTLVAVMIGAPLLILGGCASTDPIKVAPDTFTQMNAEHQRNDVVMLDTQEVSEYEVDEPVDTSLVEEVSSETGESIDDSLAMEPQVILPATPKPGSGLISFAFDQSIIDAQYGEMLWQHAQYLKENKNLVLMVSGHTDSTGAKKYNDILSEKRAKQVASILIEFGVSAERIKVSGNGSDQPLLGAITHRDHRRVELDFQDQQIVSNE